MTIEYQVTLADPLAHELEVRMQLVIPPGGKVSLTLPAWIPGSYMIRDFARNLLDVRAMDSAGDRLELQKTDKQTWVLRGTEGPAILTYRVYAYDLSVRSAYFDDTRAYFNGTSLFLCQNGQEARDHEVHLKPGGAECMEEWRVATGMPVIDIDPAGFGRYRCKGYNELIDHPFEIGNFSQADFHAAGVRHSMIFVDAEGMDVQRVSREVAPICSEHVAMFGELPVKNYLFMTLATSDGYGGLEHRNSTSLVCKRSDLPYPNTNKIDKGYRNFLALCSHEYFHLWNVKRIRPEVFAVSGLDAEVHTELLWAFEGITSYYDELALARSGVIEGDDYLDMLAPSLTRYYRTAGRHRQSVAESSFDAWSKFYKQDENAANAIVSYYNKGALIALGLDLLIRKRSDEQLCLDDLMRHLWQHFGKTGKGVPERGMEREIEKMIGESVSPFFADYVYGTEELPLQDWFADFGVGLQRRGAKNTEDAGSFVAESTPEGATRHVLQATLSEKNGLLQIARVSKGGCAEQAGLSAGDVLLAIDGERCGKGNLESLLNRKAAGSNVDIAFFRRDLLRHGTLALQKQAEDTCDLFWLDESQLPAVVCARKKAWLSSSRKEA